LALQALLKGKGNERDSQGRYVKHVIVQALQAAAHLNAGLTNEAMVAAVLQPPTTHLCSQLPLLRTARRRVTPQL
jgi:hypothetical protein